VRDRAETARAVVVPFVLSRAIVIATLFLLRHAFTTLHVTSEFRSQASLVGWDGAWYRDIASGGYDAVQPEGLRFFPLFPALGALVGAIPKVDTALGIVVIANVSAFVLGFALYRLVENERTDPAVARRAVWLVYLVPPAYVLVMGYAEATFMAAAAIFLLGIRSNRWPMAALAGLVAGLVRPVGVLLAVPALVEAVRKREWGAAFSVATPIIGLFTYLVYAPDRGHGFWYPLRVQTDAVRRGGWVDPIRGISHGVREVFTGDHLSAGLHVLTAVVMIGLLVVLYRRWPLSFAVYATAALVVALSSRNLDSLERYGLATIPFVLAGADLIADPESERVVLTLAAAGLVAASVLAFSGVLVP
jgi:hypothetical protein